MSHRRRPHRPAPPPETPHDGGRSGKLDSGDDGHPPRSWKTRWWQPVAITVAITLVSREPTPALPDFSLVSQDKIGHFAVYGALATAWVRCGQPGQRPTAFWMALAFGWAAGFGLLDELHQSRVPGRFFEWADWLADVLGAGTAVALYRWCPWWRTPLEWSLLRRRQCCTSPCSGAAYDVSLAEGPPPAPLAPEAEETAFPEPLFSRVAENPTGDRPQRTVDHG